MKKISFITDEKSKEILAWVIEYQKVNKCWPKLHEFTEQFNVTQKSVIELIESGEYRGPYHADLIVGMGTGSGSARIPQSAWEVEVHLDIRVRHAEELRKEIASLKDKLANAEATLEQITAELEAMN